MKKNKSMAVLTLIFLSTVVFAQINHKAHVHGIAKLSLAIESKQQATVDLDVAADSIFGFEYKPKSKQDLQTQNQAFEKIKTNIADIVRFDPALGCSYIVKEVGLEKAETEENHQNQHEIHGEHTDVNISYDVKCAKPLHGSKIQVHLMKLFPKVKKIIVLILNDAGQTQKEISDDHESIAL